MTKFYIGENLIEIWEDSQTIRTTFPDGTELVAAPEFTDDYIKTAKDLGYDDVWDMCKSHEILHTAMAVSHGHGYSRGLWRASQGLEPDNEDYLEEGLVMELQRRNK